MNSLFTLSSFLFGVVVVRLLFVCCYKCSLEEYSDELSLAYTLCPTCAFNKYLGRCNAIQIIMMRFLMHVCLHHDPWIVCKRTHVKGVEINDVICQYTKDDIDCDWLLFSLLFHNNPECFRFFFSLFFVYSYSRVMCLLSQYHNRYILLRRFVKMKWQPENKLRTHESEQKLKKKRIIRKNTSIDCASHNFCWNNLSIN